MHHLVKDFMKIVTEQNTNLYSIAEITGIPHPSLYRWRNGLHCPTLSKFDKVARALGYRLAIEPLGAEEQE